MILIEIVKKYKAAGAGSKCMLWPPPLLVMRQMHRLQLYSGRGGWHRSILYVFSSTGKLIYKEILAMISRVSLGAFKQQEIILIGGRVKLYVIHSKSKG
jgi:hypothetical protein